MTIRTDLTTTGDRSLQFREASPGLDFFEFSPVDFSAFALSVLSLIFSGQKSAQGILRLRNPNLGPNSGNEFWAPEFWTRIRGSNFFFLALFFSGKRGPLKNSPSRNSPPKIHLQKFNPEIGQKKFHIAPLQGHLAEIFQFYQGRTLKLTKDQFYQG